MKQKRNLDIKLSPYPFISNEHQHYISYVPSLVEKPKWFVTEKKTSVLGMSFYSEHEFVRQYQYGIIVDSVKSRGDIIRTVDIES